MKNLLLAFAAIIFLASNALAADYAGHFGDMDANADGTVTWTEFKTHFPHAEEDAFARADGNGDSGLNHDEWHAFKSEYGYGHGLEDGGGYSEHMGAGAKASQGTGKGLGQGLGTGNGMGAGKGCDKS